MRADRGRLRQPTERNPMSVPTEQQLKIALRVAVNMLSLYEPPDSRAVSDEFVALAAVDSGCAEDRVMAVLKDKLARQVECGCMPVSDNG